MKTDKDHIKDIFSSKLRGFEADLPPSLWNKIEADLPMQAPIKKVPGKLIYRALGWTAAAAAVFFTILYFIPQDTENVYTAKLIEHDNIERSRSFTQFKVTNDKNDSHDLLARPVKAQATLSLLASTSGKFVSKNKSSLPVETVSGSISSEIVTPDVNVIAENRSEDVSDVYVADAASQENFQPKDPDFERELKSKIAAFAAAGDESKNVLADNNTPLKSKKSDGAKGIAIGIGGGGGLSKSDDVANTFRYANSAFAADGLYTLRSQRFKLEHNQPVSFGIAVNKRITDRISLESGIVYTYVSARIRMEGQSEYNQNDQQYFHYFGIPLSVNYKLAEWKKAQFYTSLGSMIQKDFYGRIESKSSIDDLLNSERSSKRNISQSRPQFSATALLGVSYPLYNKLSVYTTFGGAYYFQANNEYETIFSDRKWLFNFNLGLKFGF